ncbi:AraC family transcriptional regulator [Domibacillus sp. DTU_2020_1001157_1_SI_ALB_TIR_016]|uniref:AraC family transcriptional regulator n=1 Tax=Domibacillus sp. DTU_2020_1001157_1_SI_ALB_TIR_016 TaxID=3077789 RepID=UPI0028F0BBD4|nr:AraC family transcriptional regulator [Domibacillus sp. DTU_2020_1001157_1_SI_ALB_TIR_016]WNS79049.1 AraC family transcriptional regulator [Domibacillus sp. DTU_2020_1001157_1_SI_ALB_TIR_016]
MPDEIRTIYLDDDLEVEAYRFKGIMQKFPPHFHEYYVIGFIEEGQRHLVCKDQEYIINPGDLLLFNPYDIHSCAQIDGKTLDYRCINVTREIMKKFMKEFGEEGELPYFTQNVLSNSELVPFLKDIHLKISREEKEFEKEELFFTLLEELVTDYAGHSIPPPASDQEIEKVCCYLESNYTQKIKLNELSSLIGCSKYKLVRSFTKQKRITPYNFLETIRINHAKKMLEQGIKPIEVALLTGFSDQSHLTKFFKAWVGLTPKQYMKIFKQGGLGEK